MGVVAAAIAGLLAAACAGGSSAPADTSAAPRSNVEIRFTDVAIEPPTARVTKDGNVVWLNESMSSQGAVVFPESIGSAFSCADLRPLFSKTDTGYQSVPISGEDENVTLPCPLASGSYDYQIYLFDDMTSMDNPRKTFQGTLVVE